jgi:hypothetical protein
MRALEARKAAMFQQFILNRRLGRVKKIGSPSNWGKYFGRKAFRHCAGKTGTIDSGGSRLQYYIHLLLADVATD